VPDLEDPFVEAMVLPKRKCRNCAGKGHFPIHDDSGVVNLIEQKRWFTDRQHRLRRVTEREVLPAA